MYYYLLIGLIVLVIAEPPTGGALCVTDKDCNGGTCFFNLTQGYNGTDTSGTFGCCQCPNNLANPDCSYKRISRGLAGGMEIVGDLLGVGGIGWFMLGRVGLGFGSFFLCIIHFVGIMMIVMSYVLMKNGVCKNGEDGPGYPHTFGGGCLMSGMYVTLLGVFLMAIVLPLFILPVFREPTDAFGYATIQ